MSTKTDREICEAAAKSLDMGRVYFNDGLSYVPYADFITRFTPTDVKELLDQIEDMKCCANCKHNIILNEDETKYAVVDSVIFTGTCLSWELKRV